jgi:hypothetical protein
LGAASPEGEAATGCWTPLSTFDVPRMPMGMQALNSAIKATQIGNLTQDPVAGNGTA